MIGGVEKLKDRDWKMARVIYEEQFMTFDAISRFYFGGQKGNASRRLQTLNEKKLIKWEFVGDLRTKVARLTKFGMDLFRERLPFTVKQKRRLSVVTFDHDRYVMETRLYLSKFYKAEWVPEKAIRSINLKKIPDGILTFSPDRKIAVEVENTIKALNRYDSIWREWEGQSFILILYVATKDSIYKALLKKMKSFSEANPGAKVRFGLMKYSDFGDAQLRNVWTPRGEFPLFDQQAVKL